MRILEATETTGRIFTIERPGRYMIINIGTDYLAASNWYMETCPRDQDTRVAANWVTTEAELGARYQHRHLLPEMWHRIRATATVPVAGPVVHIGEFTPSAGSTADGAAPPPAAPINLRTTAIGDTTASAAWEYDAPLPAPDIITKWQARVKSGSGAFGSWVDVTGDGATRTIDSTGLTADTVTVIEIRAVTNRYDGPASSVTFTTTV